MQIVPKTPCLSVLRIRPMALALFERFGINPWHRPQASIAEVIRCHGIPWSRFASEYEALAAPDEQGNWRRHPIYHLLDYLCLQNREIKERYLPDIQHALDLEVWKAGTTPYYSALCHMDVAPDFNRGWVGKYIAVRLLKNENRLKCNLSRLRITTHSNKVRSSVAGENEFSDRFARFLTHLQNHVALETEVLFPMAMDDEKKLCIRCMNGDQADHRLMPPIPVTTSNNPVWKEGRA